MCNMNFKIKNYGFRILFNLIEEQFREKNARFVNIKDQEIHRKCTYLTFHRNEFLHHNFIEMISFVM